MTQNKNLKPSKNLPPAFKKNMLWYIIAVSISTILFIIFSNQEWFKPISKAILNFYAIVSSIVLNIFQQGTTVNEGSIIGNNFSISIKKGCDALAPMILFIFSVLFFKAKTAHKLKGLAWGIPILGVLNIIRICTLYLIGKYSNQTIFDIMHVDVWQIFFIIFTLILWVQWLKRTELTSNVQA